MRILLAVSVAAVLAACGSEPGPAPRTPDEPSATRTSSPASERPSGPERAVESLMRALDAGDCARVKRLVVTPSAVDCAVVRAAEDSFADDGIDLDEVVYRSGPVEGSSTTVRITWGNGTPRESYDVERVRRRWLVVLDSAA